jgi:hypothetical protein
MEKSRIPTRRWRACATTAALACLVLIRAAATEAAKPAAAALDAGTFRLQWVPAEDWQAKVHRESDCVLFQYKEEPGETVAATIGVFRLVVPAQARSADKAQLGAAYVTQDVAGVQKALFHENANLKLQSKNPEAIGGGLLFSYAESLDVALNRSSSTKFFRAWVFFPQAYAANGAFYLLLGREESAMLEVRPAALEFAQELIAGIQAPTPASGR